eukprot:10430631-Heterocapsa_arctica.AAC.1
MSYTHTYTHAQATPVGGHGGGDGDLGARLSRLVGLDYTTLYHSILHGHWSTDPSRLWSTDPTRRQRKYGKGPERTTQNDLDKFKGGQYTQA